MSSSHPRISEYRVPREDHFLLSAASIVLCAAFTTGGSSQEAGIGVMLTQLAAIPLLLFALIEMGRRELFARAKWSITLLSAVVALPLMQLLPLPESIWLWPSARKLLQADLAAVGVTVLPRWSLTPAATERDFWFLLPAAALFFSTLALGRMAQRKLLWTIVWLTFASLALGVLQICAGQDSILNPFPQWEPALGGFFANPHHQSDAMAISLVLLTYFAFETRSRIRYGERLLFLPWVIAALIASFVLAIPMTLSRAGPIIAIVPVSLFVLFSGVISREKLVRHRGAQAMLALTVLVLLVGAFAAVRWTTGEKVDVIRAALTKQTALIALAHAPLGGGLGGFVPLFDQGVDVSLLGSEYINAAHNDYVQLWLEGGMLVEMCVIAVLVWYALSIRHLLKLRHRSGTRRRGLAVAAAILVILLHSIVDYPLRTPALSAVFAVLASLLSIPHPASPKTRINRAQSAAA